MPFDPNKSQPLIATNPDQFEQPRQPGQPPTLQFLKETRGGSAGAIIGGVIGLLGCLTPVFIFGYIIFNGLFAADVFPKSIHGNFTDGTIIPAGENAGKLFFIMDDSFYYTSEVSTPGSHSISTESLFNKTYSYIYDAEKGEVLERTKNTHGNKTPKFNVFALGDSIWTVGGTISDGSPELHVLDTSTNKETMDITTFTQKFSELKSGILSMQYVDDPLFFKHFNIKTLDGRNFEYFPDFDQLTTSGYELQKWLDTNKFDDMSKPAGGWVLEGNDRKDLYFIQGTKAQVISSVQAEDKDSSSDYEYQEEYKKRNGASAELPEFIATKIGGDQVFMNGEILYQDNDIVLILHQLDARDLSPKLISLAEKEKGAIWTATEDKLLPEMRTRQDDSFTSMFFIKDDFSAERVKGSVLVKFAQGGMVAFDIATGNVLWTFEPNKGWF